jgi:hypothetical protein
MSVYHANWTRRIGLVHYDVYTVASTDYAASYTTSTGASPMGQEKTPLGQRVYKRMKCIRQEILDHCSAISIYLV